MGLQQVRLVRLQKDVADRQQRDEAQR
jgi:hypothetical protein